MKKSARAVAALSILASVSASLPARANPDCKALDNARLEHLKAVNDIAIQKAFVAQVGNRIKMIRETHDGWNEGGMLVLGTAGLVITYAIGAGQGFGHFNHEGYELIWELLKRRPVFGLLFGASAVTAAKGGYDLYIHTANIDRLLNVLNEQNLELTELEAVRAEKALKLEIAQKRLRCDLSEQPRGLSAEDVQVDVKPVTN